MYHSKSASLFEKCIIIRKVHLPLVSVSLFEKCIIIRKVHHYSKSVSLFEKCITIRKVYSLIEKCITIRKVYHYSKSVTNRKVYHYSKKCITNSKSVSRKVSHFGITIRKVYLAFRKVYHPLLKVHLYSKSVILLVSVFEKCKCITIRKVYHIR